MKKWILLLAICLTAALLVPAYAAQGTLILPRELKTIGPEAFAGVRDVNQIVLPDGLTEIGDRAFADSGLGLIVMTDSVEKIASTALDGSPNACFAAMNAHQAEVCDKAGVRYMRYISDAEGAQVAESCEKAGVPYVQYKDEEGSVTVTKMNGKQAEVVIPSEILGKPVKKIEQDCFKENENLTSVVISEGITTIGSSAFSILLSVHVQLVAI